MAKLYFSKEIKLATESLSKLLEIFSGLPEIIEDHFYL